MSRPCVVPSCFLALSLMLAACVPAKQTTPTAPPQPGPAANEIPPLPEPVGPPEVALLLPLSGQAAQIGQDMQNAAEMALFDAGPNDLVLVPRDTAGTAEGASNAASAALADGADLVLGPLFSTSTRAVAPIARAQNRAVLSFSNDASVAGNGVWVLGFRPEEQVRRVVDYALAQGLTQLGALFPENAYGSLARAAWRDVTLSQGSFRSTAVTVYPADGADPSDVVREFVERYGGGGPTPSAGPDMPAADFDALLVPDGGLRLKQIVALLAFYGVDPQTTRYLGTQLWLEDPSAITDPSLSGAWIAAVSPDLEASFEQRFSDVFGRRPHPLAALAYDATALAVLLAQSDQPFSEASLTDSQGFAGHAGIFRLRSDGTTEHGLSILEFGPAGLREIDPAPTSFAVALTN